MSEEIPESAQFMMQLMSAMHTDTTATVDSLWRSAVRKAREREATLWLIRERILGLSSSDSIAHPFRYERALYPPYREVNELLIEMYGEDWADPCAMLNPSFRQF